MGNTNRHRSGHLNGKKSQSLVIMFGIKAGWLRLNG
jgi:hypothetical protein